MPQIIFLILSVVIIVLLLSRKSREAVVGICANALDRTVRKNTKKEGAFLFLKEHGEASNKEIRLAVGVSERTLVRYMSELEKEGRVEQVGATGQSVIYRPK